MRAFKATYKYEEKMKRASQLVKNAKQLLSSREILAKSSKSLPAIILKPEEKKMANFETPKLVKDAKIPFKRIVKGAIDTAIDPVKKAVHKMALQSLKFVFIVTVGYKTAKYCIKKGLYTANDWLYAKKNQENHKKSEKSSDKLKIKKIADICAKYGYKVESEKLKNVYEKPDKTQKELELSKLTEKLLSKDEKVQALVKQLHENLYSLPYSSSPLYPEVKNNQVDSDLYASFPINPYFCHHE